ncbi:MAG: FGLLP motif-containing membrane protein [Acidimicrobiales bacterium]
MLLGSLLTAITVFTTQRDASASSTPTVSTQMIGGFGLSSGGFPASMTSDGQGNLLFIQGGNPYMLAATNGTSYGTTTTQGQVYTLTTPSQIFNQAASITTTQNAACGSIAIMSVQQTVGGVTQFSLWARPSILGSGQTCSFDSTTLGPDTFTEISSSTLTSGAAPVNLVALSSGEILALAFTSTYSTYGLLEAFTPPNLSGTTLFGQPLSTGWQSLFTSALPNVSAFTLDNSGSLLAATPSGSIVGITNSESALFGTPMTSNVPATIATASNDIISMTVDANGSLYLLLSSVSTSSSTVEVLSPTTTVLAATPVTKDVVTSLPLVPTPEFDTSLTTPTALVAPPLPLSSTGSSPVLLLGTTTSLAALPLSSSSQPVSLYGASVAPGTVSVIATNEIYQPTGLATDGHGTVFIANSRGGVSALTNQTTQFDGVSVSAGIPTSLTASTAIASDVVEAVAASPQDTLFLATYSYLTNQQQLYVAPFASAPNPSNQPVTIFGQSVQPGEFTALTNFTIPSADGAVTTMAYDANSGTLAVGTTTGNLFVISSTATSLPAPATTVSSTGITGLAYSPGSVLYITTAGTNSTPSELWNYELLTTSQGSSYGLIGNRTFGGSEPNTLGVTVDASNNVFLTSDQADTFGGTATTGQVGSIAVLPQNTGTFLGTQASGGTLTTIATGVGPVNTVVESPSLGTSQLLYSANVQSGSLSAGTVGEVTDPTLPIVQPVTQVAVTQQGPTTYDLSFSAPTTGPTPSSYIVSAVVTSGSSESIVQTVTTTSPPSASTPFIVTLPQQLTAGQTLTVYVVATSPGSSSAPVSSQPIAAVTSGSPPVPSSTELSFTQVYGATPTAQAITYSEPTGSLASYDIADGSPVINLTGSTTTLPFSVNSDNCSNTVLYPPPGSSASPSSCQISVEPVAQLLAGTYTASLTLPNTTIAPVSLSLTVNPSAPQAPPVITATALSPTSAQISFTDDSTYAQTGGVSTFNIGYQAAAYIVVGSDPTPAATSSISPQSPIIFTGLTPGTTYQFTVTALNTKLSPALASSPSSNSNQITTPLPQASEPTVSPSSITFTTTYGAKAASQTLNYSEPTSSPSSFTFPSTVAITSGSSPSTAFTVTSNSCSSKTLAAGSTCSVVVSATNTSVGTASAQLAITGTPTVALSSTVNAASPLAPTNVVATSTAPSSATVSFSTDTGLAQSGGVSITKYVATATQTKTQTTTSVTASATSSPIPFTGLTPGASYTFTVTAINSASLSTTSQPSQAITILSPALVPTVSPSSLVFTTGVGGSFAAKTIMYTEPTASLPTAPFNFPTATVPSYFSISQNSCATAGSLVQGATCSIVVSATLSTALAQSVNGLLTYTVTSSSQTTPPTVTLYEEVSAVTPPTSPPVTLPSVTTTIPTTTTTITTAPTTTTTTIPPKSSSVTTTVSTAQSSSTTTSTAPVTRTQSTTVTTATPLASTPPTTSASPTTSAPATTTTLAPQPPKIAPSKAPQNSGVPVQFTISNNQGIPGSTFIFESQSIPPSCTTPIVAFDGQEVAHPTPINGRIAPLSITVPGDAKSGHNTLTLQCTPSHSTQTQSSSGAVATASFKVVSATVHLSGLDTSVLLPSQISFSPKALAKSAAVAAIAIPFIAFPTEVLNATLEEHEDDLLALRRRLRRKKNRTEAEVQESRRKNNIKLTAVLVLSALLYGLLDPRFTFNESSLITFLGLLLGLAIITFATDLPAALYLRKKDPEAVVQGHVLPGALGIAALCVVISRALHFEPGYLYGLVAGLQVVNKVRISEEDSGRAQLWSFGTMLCVSIIAWILRQPLSSLAGSDHVSFLVAGIDATLVSVFIAGVQGALISLLPLKFLPGRDLYRWNRPAWAVLFAVTVFAFVHLLLGQGSSYVGTIAGVSAAVVFSAIFVILTLGTWVFFYFYDQKRERDASESSEGQGGGEKVNFSLSQSETVDEGPKDPDDS